MFKLKYMTFETRLYFIPYTYNHLQYISPHFKDGLTRTAKSTENLSHYWSLELQRFEASKFQDNRHMKLVRLSALQIGRLYPQGDISSTHFC
jgi:hypothetical protein